MTNKEKVILDGYGKKLLAIRGSPTEYCPSGPAYSSIEIQTDKGTLHISGCSHCHVIDVVWRDSQLTVKSEKFTDEYEWYGTRQE